MLLISACIKNVTETPAPLPVEPPNPDKAVVKIMFSEIPENIIHFQSANCCFYTGNYYTVLSLDADITFPVYIWQLDTAFVRQWKDREISLYHRGKMVTPTQGTFNLITTDTFALKVLPDTNYFYVEIDLDLAD